jgi:hypothetical protein
MICLLVTILVDTSLVKVYDITYKGFVSQQTKVVLFSINSSLCLFLGFLIIKYLQSSFRRQRLNNALHVDLLYRICLISFLIFGGLMGILVFQLFFDHYYKIFIPISIIAISYGIAAAFVIKLSMLFISWYKSNHNLIVLLYFISMSMIAFNLIMTAIISDVKLTNRPDEILEFTGGSVDISIGRYVGLEIIYKASTLMSFFSIWLTTAILMNSYRERLVNAIIYWIILSIPLVYFLIDQLYRSILPDLLSSYFTTDPVTASIVTTTFLSLSQPIGGLTFAIAFWKISRIVSYEKNVRTYMIISGWGILLIFSANQGITQTLAPYPPFGLATLTVLVIAAFLMLLGIYNSATLVSMNNIVRKSIRKHALESRLLDLIGHAEMDKEIQNTVTRIVQSQDTLEMDREIGIELDENELRKYIDVVIREVKEDNKESAL